MTFISSFLGSLMRLVLVLTGCVGVWASTKMFGDIGLAGGIGGIAALLSGFSFAIMSVQITELQKQVKKLEQESKKGIS